MLLEKYSILLKYILEYKNCLGEPILKWNVTDSETVCYLYFYILQF